MMAARHALAMGAAVLAAVPVVVSPLPVSAADSALETWLHDYFTIITSPGFTDITDPAFGAFDYLDAVVLAALYGGWKDGNPADMATISVFNGFYSVGGEIYSGALFGRSTGYTTSTAYKVFAGETYDITITPRDAGTLSLSSIHYNNSFVSWSSSAGYSANGVSSQNERGGYIYYTYGSIPELDLSNPFNYIWTRGGGTNAILGKTRGSNRWYQNFPAGVIANETDAIDYIIPILEETVENYPELAPYMPDLEEPPVYPSDFAEGIPKAWTVENPRLPAYSLDLQLPTADFEAVDVSTPLEHHATGMRFWWALLGECLDRFGVKELVIFALALGLIVTILTRLGR